MKEGVFASAAAQDTDTGTNELSDFEDIEFSWDSFRMELDDAFRPVMDTPLSPTALTNLEVGGGGSSRNPILLDEGEDKENCHPKTPVSQRATEPQVAH